jgi:hypothetical protein
MTEISWPTPYGYTIFCDDIRNEIDGKVTLVGIYSADMIFKVPLPVIVPKLGIVISYFERRGESVDPIRLEVYLPGDEDGKPSITTDIPHDNFRNIPESNDPDAEDVRINAIFHMVLSPVNIIKKGRIRVRAVRGEDIIKLGSLRITTNFDTASEAVPPPA